MDDFVSLVSSGSKDALDNGLSVMRRMIHRKYLHGYLMYRKRKHQKVKRKLQKKFDRKIKLLGFVIVQGSDNAEAYIVFRHKDELFFRLMKKENVSPQFQIIEDGKYIKVNMPIDAVDNKHIIVRGKQILFIQ